MIRNIRSERHRKDNHYDWQKGKNDCAGSRYELGCLFRHAQDYAPTVAPTTLYCTERPLVVSVTLEQYNNKCCLSRGL